MAEKEPTARWPRPDTSLEAATKHAELEARRGKIDIIDEELLLGLSQRLAESRHLGRYKFDHKLPIVDEERELEKLETLTARAAELGIDQNFVSQLWQLIMTNSSGVQADMQDQQPKRHPEDFDF